MSCSADRPCQLIVFALSFKASSKWELKKNFCEQANGGTHLPRGTPDGLVRSRLRVHVAGLAPHESDRLRRPPHDRPRGRTPVHAHATHSCAHHHHQPQVRHSTFLHTTADTFAPQWLADLPRGPGHLAAKLAGEEVTNCGAATAASTSKASTCAFVQACGDQACWRSHSIAPN